MMKLLLSVVTTAWIANLGLADDKPPTSSPKAATKDAAKSAGPVAPKKTKEETSALRKAELAKEAVKAKTRALRHKAEATVMVFGEGALVVDRATGETYRARLLPPMSVADYQRRLRKTNTTAMPEYHKLLRSFGIEPDGYFVEEIRPAGSPPVEAGALPPGLSARDRALVTAQMQGQTLCGGTLPDGSKCMNRVNVGANGFCVQHGGKEPAKK